MEKSMSKSEHTKILLQKALDRILVHSTQRISPEQKLSVRAVEEEAGLGNGSAYYYREIVAKIREHVNRLNLKEPSQHSDQESALVTKLRKSLRVEKRIKEKYRFQIIKLRQQMSMLAAIQNSMTLQIQNYTAKLAEAGTEVLQLTELKNRSK